jgi:type I restriction enzyme S subunit
MFGSPVTNEKKWQLFTMADLCSHIVDCPHSTPKKVDYITQFPCIRTSELKGGTVQWETMQYLDENEYNIRISRLKPIAGDIVFGREGTIGDAVILPDGYSFCLGQRTMLLRVNRTKVSNVYLHRVILSEWVRRQIDAVNVSSTVAHVNIKDFKLFIIPLPPLDLQNQFAEKVQNIEHQKELIQKSIKEVETLFNSRMDYYFN